MKAGDLLLLCGWPSRALVKMHPWGNLSYVLFGFDVQE